MKKWILAFSMMFAAPALAAPDAVVEGVAMPAWLERDGNRVPLEAGVQLKDRDQIRTGPNARLLVKTADGSFVKLGENAVLKLDNLSQKRREQLPLFTATLDVLEGAFRFTTRVTRFVRRRDVTVIISNLTLGVRGTDVWGKAAADKDIVCLIQGKISVARGRDTPFNMDQPRSFYIAPKNAPPLPVAPVSAKQLRIWSDETEIASGQGAARLGGKWKVTVALAASQTDALAVYDRLREAGYAAEIRPANKDGKELYRVRIAHLPSKIEAEALASRLGTRMGIKEASVSR